MAASSLDVSLRLKLLNELSRPAKAAKGDVEALGGAARKLDGTRGGERLAQGVKRAGDAAGKAGREVRDLKDEVGRLGRAGVGRQLADGLDAIRKKAVDAEGAVAKLRAGLREKLQAVGAAPGQADKGDGGLPAMMPVGALAPYLAPAAVGAGVAKTFGAAISIESALAEVRKFYDLNDAQLADMKREIFGVVSELGKAPEAIAAVYAKGGQSGIPRGEVRDYARDVLLFATAWQTAGEETADGIAKLKSIFGVDRGQIMNIAGAVNAVADGLSGPVNERGLLEFLNLTGSTGKAVRLTAKDLLAFGGAFASIGMETSKSANAFNALVGKLTDANGLSDDAKKELAKVGLKPLDVEKAVKTGGIDGVVSVLEKLATAKDQLKATNEIFGLEYGNEIRDLINVLHQLRAARGLTTDDAGNVAKLKQTYETNANTTEAQIEKLKANLAMAADAQASGYLENVKQGLKAVGDELTRIREQGSVFDDLAAGAQGFAKGLGYENAGKMIEDAGKRLREALQPTETPALRQGGIFEAARKEAATLRADLEYIRDLYTSVFGSGQEKARARERVEQSFEDETVKMERYAKARGQTSPEAYLRRSMIDDDRYAAAEKRADERQRAAAPPPMPQPTPADRQAAVQKLKEELAARAGRMAAPVTVEPQLKTDEPLKVPVEPVKVPVEPEVKFDMSIRGRIEGAFSVPLEGAASESMRGYADAMKSGGGRAVAIAKQIAARIKAALDITATPTIRPRFSAAARAGVGGATPGGGSGGATPSSPLPEHTGAPSEIVDKPGILQPVTRQAARGGDVHLTQHIYGQRDPAATARFAQRKQNAAIREAKARALHDLGSPTA